MAQELSERLLKMASAAREAGALLARLDTKSKNSILLDAAEGLTRATPQIIAENNKDTDGAASRGLSEALIDRLKLDEKRIAGMADALAAVAALPDPVGELGPVRELPNGLRVRRMRIPIGVIAIIYESRPNVTSDAAALCLKSGNACILRGGSEARNSNLAIGRIFGEALRKNGVPEAAASIMESAEHEAIGELLKFSDQIDMVIPRGGEELIRYVVENSRIPVIKHYKGVCHVYVAKSADLKIAERVCFNAKVQRPGVCNAMETMLIDEDIAATFLPGMCERLAKAGVELRGCERTRAIIPQMKPACEEDWSAEYLDLILSIKVVNGPGEAVRHIERYGSAHTDAIVTNDEREADEFIRRVNSSLVLVNASTRFNDGGELGLGAEIGISTTRLHAFGPMGLRELTVEKFVAFGSGQVRE